MKYLNIALAKGRLADISIQLFEKIGIDCSGYRLDTRKLIITDEALKIRFFMVKPADVPTYVDYGAADIGVAGKDTLLEEARNLYEVLDLGFAKCRMVVAGRVPSSRAGVDSGFESVAESRVTDLPMPDVMDRVSHKRVATKYPKIAREYFERKRQESIEIITLNGSVELAPLVGLADYIVDLVETGRTLKDNGLVILDTIAEISARLVVNRVSMKMESVRIGEMINGLRGQIEKAGEVL